MAYAPFRLVFRSIFIFHWEVSRKGKIRTVINKFIVFLCTGIWHGANVTFLFWGCIMAVSSC
ncbi:MAG: hypothetical protein ACLR6B_13815 [Blautia sp.]